MCHFITLFQLQALQDNNANSRCQSAPRLLIGTSKNVAIPTKLNYHLYFEGMYFHHRTFIQETDV